MLNNLSFIGLGNMGKPMALNLLKNQYNLVIYDIPYITYYVRKHILIYCKFRISRHRVVLRASPEDTEMLIIYCKINGLIEIEQCSDFPREQGNVNNVL